MRSTFHSFGSRCWRRSRGIERARRAGSSLLGLATALCATGALAEPGFEVSPDPPGRLAWTRAGPPDVEIAAQALLAGDLRVYDERNTRDSGLRLDRALVGAEGAISRVDFSVLADLRGTDTHGGFEEAWLSSAADSRRLRATAGLQRVPLGVEHSLPEPMLPFVDYAFPAFLTGRTDWGLGLDGELADGWLSYAATATAGEGFDLHGNRRGDPQLAGRLVSYPLRPLPYAVEVAGQEIPLLSGWFVSAAASHAWGVSAPFEVSTSLRNTLITTSRIDADRALAFHLGYGVDLGPLRLLHEFARQSLYDVDLPAGGTDDFERQNASWAASIAWRITGEAYDSRPFRQRAADLLHPARPLLRNGTWGPGSIELAARYANVEIDRDLIDLGFTSAAIGGRPTGFSSQESRTFDFAVNWIPWAGTRLTFQVTRTLADQRPAAFDSHGRDTSFLVRLQVWN